MAIRRPAPSRPAPAPRVVITSSQSALRVPRKRLTELVAFVAAAEGVRIAQVDLAVVAGAEIAALNRRYLDHRGATDVISFDLSDPNDRGVVVQLVVCGDWAVQRGPLHGYRPQHELMLYVIHGLLHLTGHDDTTVRGRAAMHARQEQLLTDFLARRR